MPSWKPAYLLRGDDHGRLAERRARLRQRAEEESGTQGVEVLEGEAASSEAVAGALCAMTFALGRRFVVVDGVERWKDADVARVEPILKDLPPNTTVAFFAREEGRQKAPEKLAKLVTAAGGDVSVESAVKPWELPKWVAERAREMGLELAPGAAKALVGQVGERQQRLLRELEKLALERGPGAHIDPDDVEEAAAASSERRAWTLADAVVAGEREAAVRTFLALREQGERLPGLLYWMAQRLRVAQNLAERLETGEAPNSLKRELRMPPKAAERLIADARRAEPAAFAAAVARVADLELASRGGGPAPAAEETAALRAIVAITR